MNTYRFIPAGLREFYRETWQLALTGPSAQWCRPRICSITGATDLVPFPQGTTNRWPESNPVCGHSFSWTPTADGMQDAFTAILRINGPAIAVDPGVGRALHLAEQERDTAKLDATLADVVLQVAIFGFTPARCLGDAS